MKKLNNLLPLVNDLVRQYQPISLDEMDEVAFLNRTDTKFLMPTYRLPDLLRAASSTYQVLEINGMRDFAYRTVYFDTDDFSLFRVHLAGKMNRYKIRHRTYLATDTSYLEIKFKSNKNRTIKWRIKNRMDSGELNEQGEAFIKDRLNVSAKGFKPVIENHFNRITLVSNATKERITLDFNLSFENTAGKQCHLPYLAIVELKRDGFSNQSPFITLLKQFQIREGGVSKYCIGSALLYDLPLLNALKPKLLKLNKLKNDYDLFTVA
jgi:hypothetical protein